MTRSPLILAIVALWLLLLGAESVRPCYFLHDDNATWFIGAYVHDFRVLMETGRIAEVNYNQYGGEPFLEQGQTAVLYPPVYVAVALARIIPGDVRWAIEWLAVMHLTLGLIGFYRWLRDGGVTPNLAALAGLAWVLNPFVMFVAASWITVTFAAAWLPWLFWALDRLYRRPSFLSASLLGLIAALFFLQGYVQWTAYAFLALVVYALLHFITQRNIQRVAIVFHLIISTLIFLVLTLPLLLPLLHAVDFSAARAKSFSIIRALEYRVMRHDLFPAQFCLFHPLVFGLSTAALFCPALLAFPIMLTRFFSAGAEIRQRLFPLLLLSVGALFFASRWHFFLSLLPVLEKFRWPFKVFLFADFFLLASFVWSVSSWPARRLAWACVAVVLLAEAGVSLSGHDANYFSQATLPASTKPLPPSVDPHLGRVIAVADVPPETASYRFLIGCHATYFDIPSIGGYDPLVGRAQLDYAPGLDFPNCFQGALTPEIRSHYEARAVRYWIVDPDSSQLPTFNLAGFRMLAGDQDRLVLEDMQAAPLVYSEAAPAQPLALTYSGNSILIPLDKATSPLEVSVGPTDGWWYRIDEGPWIKPDYQNDRLRVDFPRASRQLEISYFDSRFRQGLELSGCLLVVLGVIAFAGGRFILPVSRAAFRKQSFFRRGPLEINRAF